MTLEGNTQVSNIVSDWNNNDSWDITYSGNWTDAWNNETLRSNYDNLKISLENEYGVSPAKFIGHIEDSKSMWTDVMSAATEVGVDPNLLYIIGMQEGFGSEGIWGDGSTYQSEDLYHTYQDVGLDVFFNVQDKILERGYLSDAILPYGDSHGIENEKGLEVEVGNLRGVDAWRATAALTHYYQDNLRNLFKNRGMDFDSLSEDDKVFWTYAAFNAGGGTAGKLISTYKTATNVKNTFKLKKNEAKENMELFRAFRSKASDSMYDTMNEASEKYLTIGGDFESLKYMFKDSHLNFNDSYTLLDPYIGHSHDEMVEYFSTEANKLFLLDEQGDINFDTKDRWIQSMSNWLKLKSVWQTYEVGEDVMGTYEDLPVKFRKKEGSGWKGSYANYEGDMDLVPDYVNTDAIAESIWGYYVHINDNKSQTFNYKEKEDKYYRKLMKDDSFIKYIDNVGRVAGGYKLLDYYDPFKYEAHGR